MYRWLGMALAAIMVMLTGCAVAETPTEVGQTTPAPAASSSADTGPSATDEASTTPQPGPESETPATPLPADPTAPPADGSWTLSAAGFGPIRIGETIPEDLQTRFDDGWQCFGPTIFDADNGAVEVWTDDKTVTTPVTAIVMANERARTGEGAWIGMSSEELSTMYPALAEFDAAESSPTLQVLTTEDEGIGVFFEVEDDTVVGISVQDADTFTSTSDRTCG